MLIVWARMAGAADVEIEVGHQPPSELRLFARAELKAVRGSTKGGDCQAAVAAAVAAASEGGTVLRLVRSDTDLRVLERTTCKQRVAGDAVSASVVDLTALVVQPGANTEVWPVLSPLRTAEIVEKVHELYESSQPIQIQEVAGKAWVRFAPLVEPQELDSRALDSNQRGALLYERYVSQWVVRWARVLSTLPEVHGASLEIQVTSTDATQKKSRKTEIFRFLVPSAVALAFASGTIADDALVKASRVERAVDLKKRDFLQFLLDVEDASLPSSDQAVAAPASISPQARQELDELDDIDIEDE